MSKKIVKLGAGLAVLTAAAAFVTVAGAATSANDETSAIPATCYDFFPMWNYYRSIGDNATASALFSNLVGMGCFDDLPGLLQ